MQGALHGREVGGVVLQAKGLLLAACYEIPETTMRDTPTLLAESVQAAHVTPMEWHECVLPAAGLLAMHDPAQLGVAALQCTIVSSHDGATMSVCAHRPRVGYTAAIAMNLEALI